MTKHEFNPTILREYDIRGIIDETLFEADAEAIGRSLGTLLKRDGHQNAAVGYDGRTTSPKLKASLTKGLTSTGIDVFDIGMGPTPMLYYATYALNAGGGIMITGSHNPPSHNGFKMMLGGKSFYGSQIQDLGVLSATGPFSEGDGEVIDKPIMEDYVARLLQDFVPGHELSVVWDCGNGVTGEVLRKIVAKLPGRHLLLYEEIDGSFPNHHPDPTVAENLDDMIRAVKGVNADLGIAFDGDGDRIGVVDGLGRILWGDQLLAILAREVLANHPGAPIIADVKASQILFDAVKNLGGEPIMWRTGHSLIKSKMQEVNAPLAGEMSGHIFYNDHYYGYDDAPYVALRLLNILGASVQKLEQMRDELPEMINTPELRFPCPDEEKFQAVTRIQEALAKAGANYSDIDGVRVNTDDGWWLLRASNTQAVLVARCEAKDEAGLNRLKSQLQQALLDAKVDAPTF
ncbi:phosphomannomutase/phosphoglucomutase [uncultured Sneathiella sp.]|jgi:phosphomannomutase|uniref:phosphoglucomutase/phosphomannomutase PgmG n=1 Tax=uncultured Sneathiella sp. TaxID=879315 RepID=UPI0030DDD1C9|tara:strand:- start:532 stop:1911 length:1380 start_codon:yes stop_codon:yes gene_type:complete